MTKGKKLFLLDAYALIFRAYYAFINRQMYTSQGLNTSAVFGFTVTLEEILRKEKPTHIGVVFDPPTPTFRHEIYSEYKANREETPEDIKKSVPYIKRIIEAFNIPIVEIPGFEADDVIGTLSKQAEKDGFKVYLMTPDKDFAQLVSKNVFMYKPKRSGNEAEILGVEEIKNLFQIKDPKQVVDILALWGDSSDNIPGAPGIGEKTAKKLIAEFDNIENLFRNKEKLRGKQKESIANYIDRIKLAKDLVTIRIDAPVSFLEEEYIYKGPDEEKMKELFIELEFKTIADRLLGKVMEEKRIESPEQGDLFETEAEDDILKTKMELQSIRNRKHSYYLVDDEKKRKDLIEKLCSCKSFCFDTETTNIDALKAELVGIAFSFKDHEAFYLPFPENRKDAESLLNDFASVFTDESIAKVGQNIKYDIQVLNNYNMNIQGKLFDTMIAHYLIQPEMRHNLNYLAEKYLDYAPIQIETLIGEKGSKQGNMRSVELDIIKDYACEDADITWQLMTILKRKLKEDDLLELADKIEFPLVRVLSGMETTGVKLDIGFLGKYGKSLNEDIEILEKEIINIAGEEFNVSSPKQLGIILFDKLKIQGEVPKTKSKQYSTSEEVLNRLINKHPIVAKVLAYRTLKKLLSTYVEALPRMTDPQSGKVHTSFNQTVTATGRLSSNNPNLQNIPVREERGREIRKAFIPSGNENILFSADYSQIELRLMAHMSEDDSMISAFRNHEDIHKATAARIFGVGTENVSREMRSHAKTANFGIIYGISAFGLAQRLHIKRKEAKDLIDGYFNTYPKIRQYMEKSIRKARDEGYVKTLLGRRRYVRDINSRNAIVRGFAERNAINAPLQGSAADIIKIAMINIFSKLEEKKLKSRMILQVHDELIFDVYKPELGIIKDIVVTEMESAYHLKVPLVVDYGVGENWFEAH